MNRRVRFKEIKDFSGYFVGSDGSVWSTWRRVYPKGFGRGVRYVSGGPWLRVKDHAIGQYGYRDVQLRREGQSFHRLVHRLVMFAFTGPPPSADMEVAHWDGNPSDNRVENLRWATKADNHADRWRHGTMPIGDRAYNHKLTGDARNEVARLWANGFTKTEIARRTDLSRRSVSRALEGVA